LPASPYLPQPSGVPTLPSSPITTPGPTGTNGGLPAPALGGQATSGASWPRTAATWQPSMTPTPAAPQAVNTENPPMRPLAAPPLSPQRDRTAIYAPPRAWQYSAVQWPSPAKPHAPQGWAAVPR
jgi:hypothetical protein